MFLFVPVTEFEFGLVFTLALAFELMLAFDPLRDPVRPFERSDAFSAIAQWGKRVDVHKIRAKNC